jgi:uncharacterized protein YkwD
MTRLSTLLFFLTAFAAVAAAQNNFSGSGAVTGVRAPFPDRLRVVEAVPSSNVNYGTATVEQLEAAAFTLLNERRAGVGLQLLKWNGKLAGVARLHSQSMAANKFFSHRGADGSMVDERADRGGLGEWDAIGENIAFNRGYSDPIDFAIQRWMQSSSHRANLLKSNWQESAIGIAVTPDGSYYFTQVFLQR